MKRLIALGICAFMGCGYAQDDEPISFHHLRAGGAPLNTALSGNCDGGERQTEVNCRITWFWVQLDLAPKDLPAEMEYQLDTLRKEIQANGLKRYADERCSYIRTHGRRLLRKFQSEGSIHGVAEIAEKIKLCEQPTQENFEQWTRNWVAARTKVCKVSVYEDRPVKFRRVAPLKWEGSAGPSGQCDTVQRYTLERHKEHKNLWRLTQTPTTTNTSIESCKVTRKVEYSWYGTQPQLACDRVQF